MALNVGLTLSKDPKPDKDGEKFNMMCARIVYRVSAFDVILVELWGNLIIDDDFQYEKKRRAGSMRRQLIYNKQTNNTLL